MNRVRGRVVHLFTGNQGTVACGVWIVWLFRDSRHLVNVVAPALTQSVADVTCRRCKAFCELSNKPPEVGA